MKREEAIAILDLSKLTAVSGRKYDEAVDMAIEALQREDNFLKSLETNEPIYDMVDVVRCKDCKHWASKEDYDCEIHSGAFGVGDYCSYGERKGGDDE